MKKFYATLILIPIITNLCYAHWTGGSSGIIYYNSGNLGIGTTNPAAMLSVKGSALPYSQWWGYTSSLQIGEMLIQDYTVIPQVGIGQNVYFDGVSYKYMLNGYASSMYMGANGSIVFSVFDNGASGNTVSGTGFAMTIANNGNISISTTDAKGYKLAVNGSAVATSMTVKLYGNWPDYVFHKDYKLPQLSKIKTYIDQNNHLPDMPTEGEVAKNGLNLGEVNALLTKKVEELTLYLIEKDKQLSRQKLINQVQQKTNGRLNARISKLETAITQLS